MAVPAALTVLSMWIIWVIFFNEDIPMLIYMMTIAIAASMKEGD